MPGPVGRALPGPRQCPKCIRGSVAIEADRYGVYAHYLNCGWHGRPDFVGTQQALRQAA